MSITTSISPQKRKQYEYRDPDYQQLGNVNNLVISKCNPEIQRPKITKMPKDCPGSCNDSAQMDSSLRRTEEIIDSVYNSEIAVRENQLSLIEINLLKSRKLLEKLRYNIVSQYYGEQQLNLNIRSNELIHNSNSQFGDEDKEPQTAMHPAVQKLIAKRPREMYLEREAAKNAKTTISQKIKKPIHKDRYEQKLKHYPDIILEQMGTNQNRDDKKFKTNAYNEIISPTTSDEFDSNLKTTTGIPILHKAVTTNRLNNKMKYLIAVGNTSKYIGNHMDQEFNRQGSNIFTHRWLVYVTSKASKTPLEYYVKMVRFHLHDSYRPNNVVDVMCPPFQLSRFGWGEFPIRIQLYFHSHFYEKPIQFVHHIVLDKTHTGVETIGAETTVEIWLRNMLPKEHKIQTENSIIPESSNNGIIHKAATEISSELMNNSLESKKILENKFAEDCNDEPLTQSFQTISKTYPKELQTSALNQLQKQSKQCDDKHCQLLKKKINFVPSTDYLEGNIHTKARNVLHTNQFSAKPMASFKTNDINKSTELVTPIVEECITHVNDYGNNTTKRITVTSHNNFLENNVQKIGGEIPADVYTSPLVKTYSTSACQSNINSLHETKLSTTAAFTTAVAATKIATSTIAAVCNNITQYRTYNNYIRTHEQPINSLSNVSNNHILHSTTTHTVSNALHSQQNSSKNYLKPDTVAVSASLVEHDSFTSRISKTMQTTLYTLSSPNPKSGVKSNASLNIRISNAPMKPALLTSKESVGALSTNRQMIINHIPMISVKPILNVIKPANTVIPKTITINSNEVALQQQQPKQTLHFIQRNMVQSTNTSGNVKYAPLLAITRSNVNENVNNQPYQQFVIKKQSKLNEAYKEELKPISIQTSTLQMKQQGSSGGISIPKIKPIMVTVKLPNGLLNKHISNNGTKITKIPVEETKGLSGLPATITEKHNVNLSDKNTSSAPKVKESADNLLIMQPNLTTNKINTSRIISMKNIIIQKEGKLCIIDPMQTKLKQQLQGKQVSLLKPCISFLNQQQQSKQQYANQEITANAHRLEQIFLKQNFFTMHSAVNFLLKNIKLITKSKLGINMFPFITQSLSEFQLLNAAKQRSHEWLRAKTISRLLHKHHDLQQLQRNGKYDFWSIREIAMYARHYAYTPNIKTFNPKKNTDNRIKTNKKIHNHYNHINSAVLIKNELQLNESDNIIDTTTDQGIILKWLANVWQKVNIYEQQIEDEALIDIEIGNPPNSNQSNNSSNFTKLNQLCSGSSDKWQTLIRNDDILLQIPVHLQHEYELCSNFLRKFNIQLQPEKVSAHVWHSMAHVLLAHCLQSFIDKLIRQSIALKIKQQYHGNKPKSISAITPNEYTNMEENILEIQDIVRVLRSNYADFDFLTNRNFGSNTFHFNCSQIKQENVR